MADNGNIIYVGRRQDFAGEDSRLLVKHAGRNIAVICYQDQFYAVDNACYHHGGPLLMGDIEDLGGHRCIVCPWHQYPISLQTGEGLYKGIDFPSSSPSMSVAGAVVREHTSPHHAAGLGPGLGGAPVQCIKSKGCKQRVHRVEVRGDEVYVLLNTNPTPLESDTYATQERANREDAMPAPVVKHASPGQMMRSGAMLHSSRLPPAPFSGMPSGSGSGTGPAVGYHKTKQGPPSSSSSSSCQSFGGLLSVRSSSARAGVNPLMSSSTPFTTPIGTSFFEDLSITVRKVADVCEDTRELFFTRRSGRMERQFELGEVIVIELANNQKQQMPLTIIGIDDLGHSALVRRRDREKEALMAGANDAEEIKRGAKNAGKVVADSKNALDWLYDFSLYSVMPVVSISGNFTLVDHMHRIREFSGRVLWLSAGMGISSAIAAMQAFFGDPVALPHCQQACAETDSLMMAHLHVERDRKRVPKLDTLLEWTRRHAPVLLQGDELHRKLEWQQSHGTQDFLCEAEVDGRSSSHHKRRRRHHGSSDHPSSSVSSPSDPSSSVSLYQSCRRAPVYLLNVFLTREENALNTATGAAVAAAPSLSPVALSALPGIGADGHPSHPRQGSGSRQTTSSASQLEYPPLFTYARRPTHNDIHRAMHMYFGAEPFLVYVSGPGEFVGAQVQVLQALGVAMDRIITSSDG